jgi:hypothetical protein
VTAAGIEMDGKSRQTSIDVDTFTASSDDLQVGKAAAIAGVQIGYAIPIGESFLLDIGASYLSGEAKMEALTDDTAARGDVSFKVDDVRTIFIAPTIALSDTSSLYVKVGSNTNPNDDELSFGSVPLRVKSRLCSSSVSKNCEVAIG